MKTFSESNLLLVANIAKKFDRMYGASGKLFMPLISAGCEGLLRAVEKYDYERGCNFSTLGTPLIKQAIRREIPTLLHIIHVPGNKVTAVRALKRTALVRAVLVLFFLLVVKG